MMEDWVMWLILLFILGCLTFISYYINRQYIRIKRDKLDSENAFNTWIFLAIPSSIATLVGFCSFINDGQTGKTIDTGIGVFFMGAILWGFTLSDRAQSKHSVRNPMMEYITLTLTSIGMMLLASSTEGLTQAMFIISSCYLVFVDNIWYISKLYSKRAKWYTYFGHFAAMVVIIAIQKNSKDYKIPVVLNHAEWNMTDTGNIITDTRRYYFDLNVNSMIYMFATIHSISMHVSAMFLVSDIDYFTDQVLASNGNNAIRMIDYATSTPLMMISLMSLFQKELDIVVITSITSAFVLLMVSGYYIDSDDITQTERFITMTAASFAFVIVSMCYATYISFANEAPLIPQLFMWYIWGSFYFFPGVTVFKIMTDHKTWFYEKIYVSLGGFSKLPAVAITLGGVSAANGSDETIVFTSIIFIVSIINGILFIRHG